MNEYLIESLKELLRVVLLAAVPVLIMGVENGLVDWKVVSTVALVAGLRFVDKLLHEWGKSNSTKKEESWATKGLTRF
ncbi:MAG: hypothetical protein KDH96_08975 [Candidatus Riesia sp.]|nr:hypothetical protein [Candidatus Riesia sp.]